MPDRPLPAPTAALPAVADAPRPPDGTMTGVGRVWVVRIVDRDGAAGRFRPTDHPEGA